MGISFSEHHIFGDHHPFADSKTVELLKQEPADYLLCTAKDAPKLEPIFGNRLLVLGLETTLEPELIDFVMSLAKR